MRNLSNTCYINSLTFTILWQVQQRVDINVPEAWQRAQGQGTWTPANVLRFTMLGWRQPDQQHDVVEFMQFLLPRIPWLGSAFMWGARLIDRGGIVRPIHQPNAHVLPLDPPDGMCDSNLQNTINAWHQQYAIHGLCQAPTHLYIQLPRYRETPHNLRSTPSPSISIRGTSLSRSLPTLMLLRFDGRHTASRRPSCILAPTDSKATTERLPFCRANPDYGTLTTIRLLLK